MNNFQANHSDLWLRYILWNCPQMNVTEPCWWEVTIGSGNGLVSSGNTPLPKLTQIYQSHIINMWPYDWQILVNFNLQEFTYMCSHHWSNKLHILNSSFTTNETHMNVKFRLISFWIAKTLGEPKSTSRLNEIIQNKWNDCQSYWI